MPIGCISLKFFVSAPEHRSDKPYKYIVIINCIPLPLWSFIYSDAAVDM